MGEEIFVSGQMSDQTVAAFFALLRAGLFGHTETSDSTDNVSWFDVDWGEVYQLAEEQSVVGLIAAGIDCFKIQDSSFKCPQEWALQFIGSALQLEQQNKEMNSFLGSLIERMRAVGIYTLLVKGQGVAQCYERPLWRASGDIDFYLSEDNFQKTKRFFRPLVESFDPDNEYTRHINMHYGTWVVEIHGNQYSSLSSRINKVMDEVHRALFYNGNVRSWNNNGTTIFLPSPDDDVIIVFTHFVGHFYKGGIGLRQICDWCRLLWTYREVIDVKLLERRLRQMGVMSVWKAFATLAVGYLGMHKDAMPFYSSDVKWIRKGEKICSFILEVGNFGHNRDTSYYDNESRLVRKVYSFGRRCGDMIRHSRIFPFETLCFFPSIVFNGLKAASEGE